MADRFYSEGSKNNGAAGSDANANSPKPQKTNPYSKSPAKPLGDFSENIDSNNTSKITYPQPQKKFEVHIRDFDDFVGIPEPPAETKAPKTVSQQGAPKKRSVPPTAPRTKATPKPGEAPRMPKKRSVAPTSQVQAKTKKYIPKNERKSTDNATVAGAKKRQSKPVNKKPVPTERQAKIKAKKRYNFIKTLLIASVCIVFISIITVSVSTIALQFIDDVIVIDRQGGSVSVEIPEGSDFDDVFNVLEQNDLIKQKHLCYLLLKIRDYDTMSYKPGVYLLEKDAGVEINIETIMVQKTGNKGTVRLTFPEGWTIAQIFEKLEKYEVCSDEKLYANLDIVASNYGFINEIKVDSDRYLKCEGYLFPDTYDFFIDESPSSVIEKLFNNFQNKWTAEYDKRAKELGLTVDEVMNIAAIIQREAKDGTQMATISSVIHNRLAKSSPVKSLDMNSTKDYITTLNTNFNKDYKLFSKFYSDLYLSSYNTYDCVGLPPGPICNPGATAIKAALYPADTDYYYFMHSPTGDIYVAETLSEHNKNTQLYLYN